MNEHHIRQEQFQELLRQAEKVMSETPEDFQKRPAAEVQDLIQELTAHQTEVARQNEELQRSRPELEASLKLYIDLFNFAPVGYFNLDNRGLIITANITGCDILGISRAELEKVPFTNFIEARYQDRFYAHLREIAQTGSRRSSEMEMRRKDRNIFYAQIQTVPVFDGQRMIYRVSVTDMTEHKRAEDLLKLFALIVENSVDAIFSTDRELRLRTWNKAAENQYGWHAPEVIGR